MTPPHDDPPPPPLDDPALSSSTQDADGAVVAAKNALREQLRGRRRARTDDERTTAARGLAHRARTIPELAPLLATPTFPMNAPQVVHTSCVAAYASYGTEPGTAPLRAALAAAGVGVLLPVIRDDGDLDWAWDHDDLGAGAVTAHIPEPTGDVAGRGAAGLVALRCRVLLAPALGVDLAGHRIGKAGGYYDRLLADLDTAGGRPLVVAVVFDDDVVESVPTQDHDRTVDAILTPTRYLDLR